MKRVQTTASGLASALRQMAADMPKALEHGMVDASEMLKGSLVQREIAATDPQPVDQGQYKAGWVSREVEGGAVVGNTTKQALWIERGRGPGPVPFKAILEWVKHKGFVKASVKAAKKASGPLQRDDKGRYKGATKQEIKQAEEAAALAISRKIARQGIRPRWVLRRAIDALRGKLPGILRRALADVGRA